MRSPQRRGRRRAIGQAPPEGWPQWMDRQIEEADYVLVVCTATYLRRATGKERPGVGRGVRFESVLIVQDLYDAAMWNEKFIPVLFEDARPEGNKKHPTFSRWERRLLAGSSPKP